MTICWDGSGTTQPQRACTGWLERLKPDLASSLLVRTNQGVSHLPQAQLEAVIGVLRGVLDEAASGFSGIRLESAAHYNLAVAYQRSGQDAQAMLEFNEVLDTWPGSEYGRRASAALTRAKQGNLYAIGCNHL